MTPLVWLAAALSGGAALSYEISWTRALVVPLGNSTDACALVLAGFMLGMAVGARVAGGVAESARSPLRLYALLEGLLGLYALAAPRLFALLPGISVLGHGASGLAMRYLAALVLIVAPCLAMGATLPLLVRALTGPHTSLRFQISVAYGVNTLGAGIGAFATGFWGIALLGVARCSAVAAVGSLAAALLALIASVRAKSTASRDVLGAPSPSRSTSPPLVRGLALSVGFVSGFAMLSCEMLWSRVLTFVFGHDTYAFASLLAFTLVGLATGGLLHRLVARCNQARLMTALTGAFALSVISSFGGAAAVITHLGRDPFAIEATRQLASSVWIELVRELLYTPILVLVPSILSGALYPAACSVFGDGSDDAGRKVGIFALSNGIGSALGAVLGALGLVTVAGIQGGFLLVGAIAAVLCSIAIAVQASTGRAKAVAIVPLFVVGTLAVSVPRGLPRRMLQRAVGVRHQTFLYYEEGRTATVSVTHNAINGEKVLWVNAVNEVTTRLVHDQSFKILGHLGPLLHPEPKRAVMICLGAGLSAGAAATHPLERLDVVDLSSAVPRAARRFAAENNGVLDDPIFHLHEGDGRQFLLNSAGGYDVAIIDSTHPKSVDSWILYTREFYELVRARLADGGIVVQWLPLHGLSEHEFKLIVRTFLTAFPEMTLWANAGFETYGHVAYAKLVGIKGRPLTIDVQRLGQRLEVPRIRDDLAAFGMASVEEVLDLFLAEPMAIDAWTQGLPVQTDDHPIVPYATKYSMGRPMEPVLLLGVRSPVRPLLLGMGVHEAKLSERLQAAYEAQGMVLAGMVVRGSELHPEGEKLKRFVAQMDTTAQYYASFAGMYGDDPDKLFEAGTQLGGLGFPAQARPLYDKALRMRPADFRIRLNLALVSLGMGETQHAIGLLSKLRADKPGSAIVMHNLAAALLASGDRDAAARTFKEAIDWDSESWASRLALGRIYLERGELDRAQALAQQVVGGNAWIADGWDLIGLVAQRRGDYDGAVRLHARAVGMHPYQADWHHHLGLALHGAKAFANAAEEQLLAIRIGPKQVSFVMGLGLDYSAMGKYEQAADQFVQAIELDANHATAAYQLGLALRGQGRQADAVQALCLALRLNSALRGVREQLAELGAGPQACAP